MKDENSIVSDTIADMAELLTVLLASPSSIPNILNSSPPGNISEEVWALRLVKNKIWYFEHFARHELPLHLINFLRDEAGQLLAASQTVPSPTKSSAGRCLAHNILNTSSLTSPFQTSKIPVQFSS